MLKAFGYTIVILVEAFIFTIIVFVVTHSAGLAVLAFPASIFLGILAFLIDELKKREALVLQQSQEQSAARSPSHTPVLTWNALGTHQVRTKTVVDLNLGIFDLHVGVRTDVERSKCVLSQHTHTPTNQITQITQD
jgi:hypothetical protein